MSKNNLKPPATGFTTPSQHANKFKALLQSAKPPSPLKPAHAPISHNLHTEIDKLTTVYVSEIEKEKTALKVIQSSIKLHNVSKTPLPCLSPELMDILKNYEEDSSMILKAKLKIAFMLIDACHEASKILETNQSTKEEIDAAIKAKELAQDEAAKAKSEAALSRAEMTLCKRISDGHLDNIKKLNLQLNEQDDKIADLEKRLRESSSLVRKSSIESADKLINELVQEEKALLEQEKEVIVVNPLEIACTRTVGTPTDKPATKKRKRITKTNSANKSAKKNALSEKRDLSSAQDEDLFAEFSSSINLDDFE